MRSRPALLAGVASVIGLALIVVGFALRPQPSPPAPAPPTLTATTPPPPSAEPTGQAAEERAAPELDERIYAAGRLPAVACPRPAVRGTSPDRLREFADTVVDECFMPVWKPALERTGVTLERPAIEVVRGESAESPCGAMSTDDDVLAFYCTQNATIYLFTSAAAGLAGRADWLPVSVLAHEFAHHVQNATNSWPIAKEKPGRAQRRIELQADCLSGAWFNRGRRNIDGFSVDLVLSRFVSNGTHGAAETRQQWFSAGYDRGDPAACRTYTAPVDKVE